MTCKSIIWVLGINCLLIFNTSIVNAQSIDSSCSFYPMHIGDTWQFDWIDGINQHHIRYEEIKILSDTIMPNGRTYLVFSHKYNIYSAYPLPYFTYERFDSTTGNIILYKDSLRELIRWRIAGGNDSRPVTIFNTPTAAIWRSYVNISSTRFAYGFGPIAQQEEDLAWPYFATIFYARIDGHEYGNLLAVTTNFTQTKSFQLWQNYPNPFNPTTTISFSLPSRSFVSLKIFDVMGREVSTIVNEDLQAGSYSRQWSAVGFPSGVYFYRLQAGGYTETKRLIILR